MKKHKNQKTLRTEFSVIKRLKKVINDKYVVSILSLILQFSSLCLQSSTISDPVIINTSNIYNIEIVNTPMFIID